ncbi:MAG: hypothetical protein IT444_09475 [Phycisphaeraceae bacterium]|nr:hypothetical protein [Phycisphaeraceae bacterium]
MAESSAPSRITYEGAIPALATEAERREAMDQAFDYRGDVTIHTSEGKVIEGYIFDRRSDVPEPYVRLIPRDSNERIHVKYQQITRLIFSGRDTAAGKSWETWLKKYHEKKAKGEAANIESEPLDE